MLGENRERGNATAEFVMVSALVVLLFLGVLQVAFALFARNVVQDAASQGARYGALEDRNPQDATGRAEELIYSVLPSSYPASVSSSVVDWQGLPAVQVRVEAAVPLLGPFGVPATWEVTGHAVLQ